jgi:hypothetical protein
MITVIISDENFKKIKTIKADRKFLKYPENKLKLKEIKNFVKDICENGKDIVILTRNYFILSEFAFYKNIQYISFYKKGNKTKIERSNNKDKLEYNVVEDYFVNLYKREQQ